MSERAIDEPLKCTDWACSKETRLHRCTSHRHLISLYLPDLNHISSRSPHFHLPVQLSIFIRARDGCLEKLPGSPTPLRTSVGAGRSPGCPSTEKSPGKDGAIQHHSQSHPSDYQPVVESPMHRKRVEVQDALPGAFFKKFLG